MKWVMPAILVVGVVASCTLIGEEDAAAIRTEELYPRRYTAVRDVCCKATFNNSFIVLNGPTVMIEGNGGRILLANDGRLWTYDVGGKLLSESEVPDGRLCQASQRANLITFACRSDGTLRLMTVDASGIFKNRFAVPDDYALGGRFYAHPVGTSVGLWAHGQMQYLTQFSPDGSAVALHHFEERTLTEFDWREDGGVVVAGWGRDGFSAFGWIVSLDPSGELTWEREIRDCDSCKIASIRSMSGGLLAMYGGEADEGIGHSITRGWVRLLDEDGQEIGDRSEFFQHRGETILFAHRFAGRIEVVLRDPYQHRNQTVRVGKSGRIEENYIWPRLSEDCIPSDFSILNSGRFRILHVCYDAIPGLSGRATGVSWYQVATAG